jgi:hypothetical protein
MGQTKRSRKALRGLEAITVWVHNVAEDAGADGVSRQHLQDAVVIRLLDSGIRALGIGNVPEPPGNPWLNVFVNTVRSGDQYYYSITVRLDEVVRPLRNSSIKTSGTTWEAGSRGVVKKEDLPRILEKGVDDLMEYFIYDYFLENPR